MDMLPQHARPPTIFEYVVVIVLIIVLVIILIGQFRSLYTPVSSKPPKKKQKYRHPGIHPDIDMRL